MIQRLFDRHADLFRIRDQGGCYFVPAEHIGFVDKVEKFVASSTATSAASRSRPARPKATGR